MKGSVWESHRKTENTINKERRGMSKMWLYYVLLEKTDTSYRYAYSRECRECDGILVYDIATQVATVIMTVKLQRANQKHYLGATSLTEFSIISK